MIRGGPWLLPLVLLAGACSSPEVLVPRDGTVPTGVDLSGNWTIRDNESADERRLRDAIRKTANIKNSDIMSQTGGSSRSANNRAKGGLVFIFLETGTNLKVTQTPGGLFISFDRAIVEEFRFGENRVVSVGQIEAQRVTGWEDETLIVETLDRNGMKLTERFHLIDGGDTLERTIILRSSEGERESMIQLFDRVGA